VNLDFPPLAIPQPETAPRRREGPRAIPLAPELLAKRVEIAQRLAAQVTPLSNSLRAMGEQERRAVFYKLEHDGPVSLTGTGLKPVAEPSENYTLAVPVKEDLSGFTAKINQFATSAPRGGIVPNSRLVAAIETITLGQPQDRLSQELLDNYETLVAQESLLCEIEMLSLLPGLRQRRDELMSFRHALQSELSRDVGGFGAFFEHEEIKGTVRVVIRCSGVLFKRLVEDSTWQRRIYWFEARPEFQTFSTIANNFSIERMGSINSPPDDAPVVCIIDSGVTAGNPFLGPVVVDDLQKSFLASDPDPSDSFGHGSGVASLAAYLDLNPMEGGENNAKVWIANARILTAENDLEEGRLFSSILREVVEYYVPRGIKIFNLSVNVRNLSWNKNAKRTHPRRSWVARAIDHLAKEYDIVFVISTGNILPQHVRDYHRDGKPYPQYFADDDTCILDPGQAALAVTVGSSVPTTLAEGQTARARALAERHDASPFTRCGPGIRKEIKPELTDYGGNYLLDEESGIVRSNRGLSYP
jgi:hypothetical protein